METTSVVIVTHQSVELVADALDAITASDSRPDEIVVVDNASTDGTRSVLDRYDVVRVDLEDNVGFAGGCHVGVDAASGEVLVFLGHDCVPEPGWLEPLVRTVRDDTVGAAMATVVDADDATRFNTSGGHLSYVGLAWVSDLGDVIPDVEPEIVDVAFPSGAAMALRRATWDRFDGFRRDLFMYLEDVDLGWRMRVAGLRVVRCSASRVRHRYDFERTAGKMYFLERNRWRLLAANYRRGTLVTLLPALIVTEIGIVVVALRDGWIRQKMRAWRDTAGSSDRHAIRRHVESERVIGDAAMLAAMDASVSSVRQISAPRGSTAVDAFLAGYRRLVLPLIGWLDRLG